jgi:hypothetical protein
MKLFLSQQDAITIILCQLVGKEKTILSHMKASTCVEDICINAGLSAMELAFWISREEAIH